MACSSFLKPRAEVLGVFCCGCLAGEGRPSGGEDGGAGTQGVGGVLEEGHAGREGRESVEAGAQGVAVRLKFREPDVSYTRYTILVVEEAVGKVGSSGSRQASVMRAIPSGR